MDESQVHALIVYQLQPDFEHLPDKSILTCPSTSSISQFKQITTAGLFEAVGNIPCR